MQRQHVISSDSSDLGLSDNNPEILNQALIKKSLAPVFALGKASRLLKKYVGQDLSNLDKRLLKGFYVADAGELANDYEEA